MFANRIVGTGVLDCPKRQKFDTQKQRDNPDRFSKSVGVFLCIKQSYILLFVSNKSQATSMTYLVSIRIWIIKFDKLPSTLRAKL